MADQATAVAESSIVLTDNGDGTFTCSACGKTFSNNAKTVHPSKHKNYTCEFCGKVVMGSDRYGGHLKSHKLNSAMQVRLLDLIREFPGLQPRKYAKMLNVRAKQLTSPSRKLQEKGLIEKVGRTQGSVWQPIEGADLPMHEFRSKREMRRAEKMAQRAEEQAQAKREQAENARQNGAAKERTHATMIESPFESSSTVQFIATQDGEFLLLNGKLYHVALEPVV